MLRAILRLCVVVSFSSQEARRPTTWWSVAARCTVRVGFPATRRRTGLEKQSCKMWPHEGIRAWRSCHQLVRFTQQHKMLSRHGSTCWSSPRRGVWRNSSDPQCHRLFLFLLLGGVAVSVLARHVAVTRFPPHPCLVARAITALIVEILVLRDGGGVRTTGRRGDSQLMAQLRCGTLAILWAERFSTSRRASKVGVFGTRRPPSRQQEFGTSSGAIT